MKAASGDPPSAALDEDSSPEGPLAALRAEAHGYLRPGRPDEAGAIAYTEASKTHVRNGVYAAMAVAASNAWALVSQDPFEIVEAGLSQIPQGSRLVRSARLAMSLARAKLDEDEARGLLGKHMADLPRFHSVRFVTESVTSFLMAGDNFSRAAAGGPLAASWAGARLGLRAIPLALRTSPEGILWTGFEILPEVRIADMVRENLRMVRNATAQEGPR